MVFENVVQFRAAISKYAIHRGVSLRMRSNEPKRVRVTCKDGCPWLLFASLETQSNNFIIKSYNPVHQCYRTNRQCTNRQCTNRQCNANFIARIFEDRIISQVSIKLWELHDLCKQQLGCRKIHL